MQACLCVGTPQRGRRGTWQHRYDSAHIVPTASPCPACPCPVPSYRPAGTTQLTPFPSAAEGNRPTTIAPSSSSCPRLDLPLYYALLAPTAPYPRAPTIPILAGCRRLVCAPLLSSRQHTGAISTTARRGVARRAASPRRDERAKPAQKVPFERKTPLFHFPPPVLSLSLSLYPCTADRRPILLLSLFVRLRGTFAPLPPLSSPVPSRCFAPLSSLTLLPFLLLLFRIFFFRAFCHSVSVRPVAVTNNAT